MKITWTDTGAITVLPRTSLFTRATRIVLDPHGATIDDERVPLDSTIQRVGRFIVIDSRRRQWSFRHGAEPDELERFMAAFRRALHVGVQRRGAGSDDVPEALRARGAVRTDR